MNSLEEWLVVEGRSFDIRSKGKGIIATAYVHHCTIAIGWGKHIASAEADLLLNLNKRLGILT